jgi:hypothetical protein
VSSVLIPANWGFNSYQFFGKTPDLVEESAHPFAESRYLRGPHQSLGNETVDRCHGGNTVVGLRSGLDPSALSSQAFHDIGWSRVKYDYFVQAPPEKMQESWSAKEHMVQSAMLETDRLDQEMLARAEGPDGPMVN